MSRKQKAEQPAQIPSGQPPSGAPQAAPRSRRGSRRRFFTPLPIFTGTFLLVFTGNLIWIAVSHFRHSGSHAAPIWRPLSAEPDGKILYADSLDNEAVWEITEGKPASQIIISENDVGSRWTLFKMAGHVYLRGYIAKPDSVYSASPDPLRSLQGHTLEVYSDSSLSGLGGTVWGESTSKITLRIDKYGVSSDDDDLYSEVTVPNFQPDSHTTLNDWH